VRRVAGRKAREQQRGRGDDEDKRDGGSEPAEKERNEIGNHLFIKCINDSRFHFRAPATDNASAFHSTGGCSTEGVAPGTRAFTAVVIFGAAKYTIGWCSAMILCTSANARRRAAASGDAATTCISSSILPSHSVAGFGCDGFQKWNDPELIQNSRLR